MQANANHIHPQLLADTHPLLVHEHCHIRVHRNATLPWAILIPPAECIEFCDLTTRQQLHITRLSRLIGDHFKRHMGAEKINFAAIGNVVQQLHIHVIGRHRKDPLWPDVAWGRTLPEKHWTEASLAQLKAGISATMEDLD